MVPEGSPGPRDPWAYRDCPGRLERRGRTVTLVQWAPRAPLDHVDPKEHQGPTAGMDPQDHSDSLGLLEIRASQERVARLGCLEVGE